MRCSPVGPAATRLPPPHPLSVIVAFVFARYCYLHSHPRWVDPSTHALTPSFPCCRRCADKSDRPKKYTPKPKRERKPKQKPKPKHKPQSDGAAAAAAAPSESSPSTGERGAGGGPHVRGGGAAVPFRFVSFRFVSFLSLTRISLFLFLSSAPFANPNELLSDLYFAFGRPPQPTCPTCPTWATGATWATWAGPLRRPRARPRGPPTTPSGPNRKANSPTRKTTGRAAARGTSGVCVRGAV